MNTLVVVLVVLSYVSVEAVVNTGCKTEADCKEGQYCHTPTIYGWKKGFCYNFVEEDGVCNANGLVCSSELECVFIVENKYFTIGFCTNMAVPDDVNLHIPEANNHDEVVSPQVGIPKVGDILDKETFTIPDAPPEVIDIPDAV